MSKEITYEQFTDMELRIGRVKEAERVPKSTKLIKMQVSFGEYQRQIIAGIGETYEIIDLIDNQYLFIVNLAPRKIMDFDSHGMMLATGEDRTKLVLLNPSKDVIDGSEVG